MLKTLKLRNGSQFDVIGAGDTTRGGRRHSGLIDELRDHDGEEINSVVIPLLNVSRTLPSGEVNPNEKINQQCVCMTSAGSKLSYAYNKLIDVFEESIIFPKQAFCFGCDYRVPMMHGLLNKAFINKLKMSPSFDERSFAAEYLSLWQGSTEDSWFNFDKMGKYRRIKNPEKKYLKSRCGDNGFYLISMDVGRLHDKSEVCVFRVNILNEVFYISLVNIITLGLTAESKQMSVQARDLKEIIERYNPKEVLIDCNGLIILGHLKFL